MNKFIYEPRERCACGTILAPVEKSRTRTFAWGKVSFRSCRACGSWCQSPQLTRQTVACWYDSDDYQGSSTRIGQFYANYIDDEPARIEEARMRYRRELERFAAAAARLHGLAVRVADFAEIDFPARSFDLVLLYGTISNLRDPAACLRQVCRVLKPGGTLVVNFPAADSFTARLYGPRFWMYAPSVNTFFTTVGLSRALRHAGFLTVRFTRDKQQPSLRKVTTLARLPGTAFLARIGLDRAHLPFPVPAPGVRCVFATKDGTA
jgi:SAM-dependent methyltransferase